MAKITGIGGVFFKSKGDHKALAAWYAKHLGLELAPWGGAALKWPEGAAPDGGATAWHVAAADSQWFSPSDASFMINYRVDDLAALLTQLEQDGVTIVKPLESHENGHFAWILDLEGNKVELWQPLPFEESKGE